METSQFLNEFFNEAQKLSEIAKNLMILSGHHIAMIMVIDRNLGTHIIPIIDYEDKKGIIAKTVREYVKRVNAVGVIHITEAWTKYFEKDEDAIISEEGLKNDPERKEALVIHAMTRCETRAYDYEVHRDIEGNVTNLTKMPIYGETLDCSGRFAEFFDATN